MLFQAQYSRNCLTSGENGLLGRLWETSPGSEAAAICVASAPDADGSENDADIDRGEKLFIEADRDRSGGLAFR
jgi:hypothetical protein